MTWDKCILIGIKCILFCGDYKEVLHDNNCNYMVIMTDTMLYSRNSVIKSWQEDTSYGGGGEALDREVGQCKNHWQT